MNSAVSIPASPFTAEALGAYLAGLHKRRVDEVRVTPLGGGRQGDKGYGYGIPLRVDYTLDGTPRRAVLESVRPGAFGHEHMADRAQMMLWSHHAFGGLPRHVRSLDVGAVRSGGSLVALGDTEEFFMLADFVEGAEYADDLLRLRAGGPLRAAAERTRDSMCGAFGSSSATASASSASPTPILRRPVSTRRCATSRSSA
jgi:hypothetical protein